MKKYLFLATAIATASLFTGCSNNEYVGDQPEALNGTDGAIAFSMGKANTTRAEEAKPANTYFTHFYVYGEKTPSDASSAVPVFNTYKVEYKATPDNSTASNTTGWEYVGNLWDNGGHEKNNVGGKVDNQTIKYWDYSASKYTFYAFSAKPENVKEAAPKIKVSNINTSEESYTVTIKNGAEIENLYFADKKVVEKPTTNTAADPTAEGKYGGYVQLKFRNLASKVRVGFYETVPGYSIKINKMYPANGDRFASDGNASGFMAICPNTVASQNSKITVKYYGTGNDADNQAYVEAKKKTDEEGGGNLLAVNTLTLGGGVFNTDLATTSSSPTWDNAGKYTFFWPQETNDKPLKIKVDYTLTSTDGSREEIKVTGATATVPKEYVQWAANTAYTYIFKISDNTNGTTGGGAPEGLYPITFDAVVQDYANEGSITTVSTPSVTASQNGVSFVSPDNGIKFETTKDIFLKVMNGDNEVKDVAIKSAYVTSYDYGKTPDQNRGDVVWTDVAYDGTNKYYKLAKDKQTADGWWILEVKESNASGAATTYVIIRVGDAEVGPANQ